MSIKAEIPSKTEDILDLMLDDDSRQDWDENHDMQEVLDGFLVNEIDNLDESNTGKYGFLFKDEAKLDEANKKEIIELCKTIEETKGYKIKFVTVQYSSMKSPAPMMVAKRDFVTVCLVGQCVKTKAFVFCLTSIDYNLPTSLAQKAKSGGYVRAKHICTGTLLRNTNNVTEFFTVSMIDPGAYVPPRIIKMFAPKRAYELPGLSEFAATRKSKNIPGASALFSS